VYTTLAKQISLNYSACFLYTTAVLLKTAMFCPLEEFVNMMPKAAEANEHADLEQIIKRVRLLLL
jgi:hypothetical protein